MTKASVASIVLSVLVVSTATAGAERKWYTYGLPGDGGLQLEVPTAWKQEVRQKEPNLPPTIVLRPRKGQALEVLITPFRPQDGRAPEIADFETELMELGARYLPTAQQEFVTLETLKGEEMVGRYFLLTEKETPPGEYSNVIGGTAVVGPLVVSFTILSHAPESDELNDAFEVIESARFQRGILGVYRAAIEDLRVNVMLGEAAGLPVKALVSDRESYRVEVAGFLVEAAVVEPGILQVHIDGEDLEAARGLLEALTHGFQPSR